MAIFNATLQSGKTPDGVFTAFCETTEDLEAPAAEAWDKGSVIVCLNTDGDKVPATYVKLPDGTWSEVSNG